MSPFGALMANLRRRPVRTRLAIFSSVLTAVILIGFAVVVGRLVQNRLQADFREEVRNTAAELSLNISIVTRPDGHLQYNGPDLEEVAMTNDAAIKIVDGAGRPTTFGSQDAPPLGPPGDGSVRDAGDDLRVADQQIRLNRSFSGPLYIQYARNPASVDATIDRLWLFLGGGVVIGTLLAGFAGMTLANRAMQPIANLTGTARTIARTRDPSMRIPEPESQDEVAELARTLDEMLRELDAARTETEQTIKRQREFVADASHELRTPLTSILANLELLEATLPDDEDQRTAARSALRSSRRMSRLVADLLILARADAGRREEPIDCDLSTIACEAFEEVHPVSGEHTLEARIDPGARLNGNPDELHRMILNLLENAIRHTPAGSAIDLTLDREGDNARLEVTDDGPGLPEEAREQVFERFVRGSGPADRQGSKGDGTGLGLAIVRAVATAHGGSVEAGESAAGGARFSVIMPLATAGDPEPAEV